MVATLISGDETRSGVAVEERALRCVGGLTHLGVSEGDIVAVMMRNEMVYLEAMLALRLAGAYAYPINWHFKASEAGYILRDCGARVLIAHSDLLQQIQGGIPDGTQVIAVEPPPTLRTAFKLDLSECIAPPNALD